MRCICMKNQKRLDPNIFAKESIWKLMAKMCLPAGISTLLNSVSGIFENNLLVAHGDHYVAALSVARRATMIIGMLQIGVAMGVQPIISYSYGAKNWKRMRETLQKVSYALFISILRQGLIFIPVLYLLDHIAGFRGIVWAQPIATFAALGLGIAFAMHHYKKIQADKVQI